VYDVESEVVATLVPITAITGTTLLTCQSNRFVDNSANNLVLTNNGTPSIQAFSPFVPAYITPTTYSNWFNKSTGYLTVPSNTAFNFSTGDFTIECWVWFNQTADASGGGQCVVSGTSAGYPVLYISTNGGTTLSFAHSSSIVVGGTIRIGAWNHVAVSRSGSSLRFFVNGILAQTATYSTAIDFGGVYIGAQSIGGVVGFIDGAISNLRMLKGTALYTANFTPPAEPLTNITNTSLLTCQSSTFIDNSTANSGSAFTVTAVGGVYPVTSPTPFPAKVDTTTLNSAYSTSLIGGSAYFDGSGDYLTAANNAAFSLPADFTIDFWWYPMDLSGSSNLFCIGDSRASYNGLLLYWSTGAGKLILYSNGANVVVSSLTTPINTWYHIAAVRSGSTVTFYINGASVGTATNTTTFTGLAGNGFSIGAEYYGTFDSSRKMYMTGMRLVKGTALYASNFAPPLTPPTAVTNTQLLTNFTNGAIFDSTAKNVFETVGNAQISTSQSKYGGTSMYFPSAGSYLKAPSNANWGLGTGDYTIEFWLYKTTSTSYGSIISVGYGAGGIGIAIASDASVVVTRPGTAIDFTFSAGLALNAWYHVAICRSGTSLRCFANGVQVGSTQTSSTNYASSYLNIGIDGDNSGQQYVGYIDDLRITKYARYVANFTPPTSQLQDQ